MQVEIVVDELPSNTGENSQQIRNVYLLSDTSDQLPTSGFESCANV